MKYTIFSFLLLMCLSGRSQDIVPVVQTGHSSDVKFVAVDYTKNILLSADEHEFMLWNLNSGRQLRRVAAPSRIRGAVLCSDGNEVAVANYVYGEDAAIRIYSAATGALLSTIPFIDSSWGSISYRSLDELVYDRKFNRLAVRSSNDWYLVDVNSRRRLQKVRFGSYADKFGFTDSVQRFARAYQADDSLHFAIVDSTGAVVRSTAFGVKAVPLRMATNVAQNAFYVLDSKAMVRHVTTSLVSAVVVEDDSLHSLSTYSPPTLVVNEDGNQLLLPFSGSRYLYDLPAKKWIQAGWKWVSSGNLLAFLNERGDRALQVNGGLMFVVDAATGQRIFELLSTNIGNKNVRLSPSGRMMSTFHSSSFSKTSAVLDLKTGIQFNAEIDYALFQWVSDSVVLCAPYATWDEKKSTFDNTVELRNVYTGAVLKRFSVGDVTNIEYAAISSDGKKVGVVALKELFVFYGNQFEKRISYKIPGTALGRTVFFTPDSKKLVFPTEVIRVFDFSSQKWMQLKDTANYDFRQICFLPGSQEIWYEDYRRMPGKNGMGERKQSLVSANLETGVVTVRKTFDTLLASIAVHPGDDMYALGFFNGTVEIRRRSDDQLLYRGHDHSGTVDELLFAGTRPWLLSTGDDELTRILNYTTKEPIATAALLYKAGEKGYALLAPDNHYLVPATLVNEMHFVKDFDTYSFSQFDLYLNRPDIVLASLGFADPELLAMHRKAFRRRIAKAGVAGEQLPPISSLPQVQLLNRKQIGYTVRKQMLPVNIATQQDPSVINAAVVYINGQRVMALPGGKASWQADLPLAAGLNNIEFSYFTHSGLESLRERIEVNFLPEEPVTARTYYIGIAVSHYKDTAMNLRYAVKDVEDIAARFKKKDSSVQTFLFTDEKVSRQALTQIRQILLGTGVDDKVVMSFSGHGMLDTAYNFYFAGWDMNFNKPGVTGISYNDISALLAGIPARKKLVLIDACHSGEVDRDVVRFATSTADTSQVKTYGRSSIKLKDKGNLQNTVKLMEQYFTDINKDNGTNVISAAAGEEYALESSEWNNGVFSYCFMSGLFGKKADKNSDGKISQTELRKYIQQTVLQLTKGRQQPTSRSINADFDWEF